MNEIRSHWERGEENEYVEEDATRTTPSHQPARGGTPRETYQRPSHGAETGIWLNSELQQREATTQLDDQDPVTLYYLGRVAKLDGVVEVYVDKKRSGEIKHWTVIESRDFALMDDIYDIELDAREKFPYADIDFRVTVYTGDGPSAADRSMKVYDSG